MSNHVWPDPGHPDHLILVSGRHRLEAARLAGLTHIASVVLTGSEADTAILALVQLTNPGRQGSAWETAQAMKVLQERLDQASSRILAPLVGLGRTQVAQYIRVAKKLPEDAVREALGADIGPAALNSLPLSCLYEIAGSDDSLLEDRIHRLTREIRTRQARANSKSAPVPLNAGWLWAGIAALVALASVVGFYL